MGDKKYFGGDPTAPPPPQKKPRSAHVVIGSGTDLSSLGLPVHRPGLRVLFPPELCSDNNILAVPEEELYLHLGCGYLGVVVDESLDVSLPVETLDVAAQADAQRCHDGGLAGSVRTNSHVKVGSWGQMCIRIKDN